MSDRDQQTTTGTHARVTNLEADVREMRHTVSTIQMAVQEISASMLRIRDAFEASAKEASEYRHETSATLKCLSANNQKYRPILDELIEKRDEAKALRRHVRFAWMTAAGLAAGGTFMAWADSKWKAIAVLIGKGGG